MAASLTSRSPVRRALGPEASERAASIVVADDGAHSLIDLLSRNIDLRIVFRSSSSTVIDCKSRMISSARSVTP
jgi:hypothetical protein